MSGERPFRIRPGDIEQRLKAVEASVRRITLFEGTRGVLSTVGWVDVGAYVRLNNSTDLVVIGSDTLLDGGTKVQIQANASEKALYIVGGTVSGTQARLVNDGNNSWEWVSAGTSVAPIHIFERSRGTIAVPTDVAVNDVLARHVYDGYQNTVQRQAAEIRVIAEALGATSVDGQIRFYVASSGALSEILRLSATNRVLFPSGADIGEPAANRPSNAYINGLVAAERLQSTVATGTAPIVVASTTKVTNLNADLLDGNDSAFFATASSVADHLADGTDAHDASAISYNGSAGLSATDVEAALDELDTEKSATGHTHTHASTTGQTADDHHAKSHAHNGADGSGTVAHSATTGQTANDHHNQAHAMTGADHTGVGTTVVASKAGNEGVTSSTVLQSDDDLQFTIGASERYIVDYTLMYNGDAAGDIKFGFSAPAGSTVYWGAMDAETPRWFGINAGTAAGNALQTISGSLSFGCLGTATRQGIVLRAIVTCGGTGGTVALEWAQATSNGTATTVMAGSSLVGHRVL